MKDNFKIFLSILILIAVCALWLFLFKSDEGSTASQNDGTVTTVNDNKPVKESMDNPPSDKINQYRMRYNYFGNQDLIIDLMDIDAAIVMEYEGSDNFKAVLKNNKGEDIKVLADTKGPYAEIIRFTAPYTGAYLLEVRTSGNWFVEQR